MAAFELWRVSQCGHKLRHATRADARQHKRALLERDPGATINVYRCPHCGWFHVGNSFGKRVHDVKHG